MDPLHDDPRFGDLMNKMIFNAMLVRRFKTDGIRTLNSRGGFDDHVIAGYALRTAAALEESGFYDHSGAFPGFGRGREHGDFQHRERGFVAFASFFAPGAVGEDRGQQSRRGGAGYWTLRSRTGRSQIKGGRL